MKTILLNVDIDDNTRLIMLMCIPRKHEYTLSASDRQGLNVRTCVKYAVTATHNFKWVKITHICLIWDQSFANLDV